MRYRFEMRALALMRVIVVEEKGGGGFMGALLYALSQA